MAGRASMDEVLVYRQEVDRLLVYIKEFLGRTVGLEEVRDDGPLRLDDRVVACLLEESCLPFKKLVQEVRRRLEVKDGVTLRSVESAVLRVGERCMYGVEEVETSLLDDESEACNWCWEMRDLKFLPESQRGVFGIRRRCRKIIHERITALLGMIAALSEPEMCRGSKTNIANASDRLMKTSNETQLRSLAESLFNKNETKLNAHKTKKEEKQLVRNIEGSEKDIDRKRKLEERELIKEKLQSEKEQKKLQYASEKERLREAKLHKRQLEVDEKNNKRREKEEAEIRKQLSIQKQATIMEQFLRHSKVNADSQDKASSSLPSHLPQQALTTLMDSVFSENHESDISCLLKSHLAVWRKLGHSLPFKSWGYRQKPKVQLVKELRLLGTSSETHSSTKRTPLAAKLELMPDVDVGEGASFYNVLISHSIGMTLADCRPCRRRKKLLQFYDSYRPAYYGSISQKSDVVGPRCPLKKDLLLDYDNDSDEEWIEEDPGESISDSNEDDEDDSSDDEDASDNSFFIVPDDCLPENEGVQPDSSDIGDDCKYTSCHLQLEEESGLKDFLENQGCLIKLTELALHRNSPVVISNLTHEKSSIKIKGPTGNSRLEQMCLQALNIRPWYRGACVKLPTNCSYLTNDDLNDCISKVETDAVAVKGTMTALSDSDLPQP